MKHILLVSGTMNPPHRAHIMMGIHAADSLKRKGHCVDAVYYVPVHDNYLANKVRSTASNAAQPMCCPMGMRTQLLAFLILQENREDLNLQVLDFESQHQDLLSESEYWARKLPSGYLRTIPTSSLVASFRAEFASETNSKLAVVFGSDNLPAMAGWNNSSAAFENTDLVLCGRQASTVRFESDPYPLLRQFRFYDIECELAVNYGDQHLFGTAQGQFNYADGIGSSNLFLIPPLEGVLEACSSTSIREAIETLRVHGYSMLDSDSTNNTATPSSLMPNITSSSIRPAMPKLQHILAEKEGSISSAKDAITVLMDQRGTQGAALHRTQPNNRRLAAPKASAALGALLGSPRSRL